MSLVSPSGLLAAACLLAALGLLHYMRSPLRKAPGPKLAVFTSMVLKWHELRAARTSYIHQLHQRYGPVRLRQDRLLQSLPNISQETHVRLASQGRSCQTQENHC
ncbi:hypothetical protein CDD81_6919 [Ophiocordyceps australis]|uniref:Uncharacterized protein n=1 Tax=Ophiocordyceps australis TaxID=1399860 RepID=A0A2C5Y4G0_9HYPO|nr:hypothetical protein CDD81_6919 [Ophiocordyceps australis]